MYQNVANMCQTCSKNVANNLFVKYANKCIYMQLARHEARARLHARAGAERRRGLLPLTVDPSHAVSILSTIVVLI